MKCLIVSLLCLLIFSCSSINNFEKKVLKVIAIEEFKSYYRFKALDKNLKDTVNLISLKYQQLRKDRKVSKFKATSQIVSQKNYTFKTQKIRIRTSTMEQLGKWIIIEKDTLWKGNSKEVEPKYFNLVNALGLGISE